MQKKYWPAWKNFLAQQGLKPLASELLVNARPLFPIAAQFMLLGFPLFKASPLRNQYTALLNLLGDEEQAHQFLSYLQEIGV